MGLNHLEAEHPCKDYGAKCRKCRLRPWYMTVREKPPEKEEHRCQVCVERESLGWLTPREFIERCVV